MTYDSSNAADATRSIFQRYANEVRSLLRSCTDRRVPDSKQRRESRRVAAELDELRAERRSLPPPFRVFGELQRLLAAVPAADRLLIEQRLVLSMHWRDIALQRGATGEAELERESARLRKRFQRLLRDLLERAATARSSIAAE